jgi:hypothetical protein
VPDTKIRRILCAVLAIEVLASPSAAVTLTEAVASPCARGAPVDVLAQATSVLTAEVADLCGDFIAFLMLAPQF